MAQGCQCGLQMPGEILIQLQLHSSVPVFQTLSKVRRMGESGVNVVFGQFWVVIQNVRRRHALGHAVEDHGDFTAWGSTRS